MSSVTVEMMIRKFEIMPDQVKNNVEGVILEKPFKTGYLQSSPLLAQ